MVAEVKLRIKPIYRFCSWTRWWRSRYASWQRWRHRRHYVVDSQSEAKSFLHCTGPHHRLWRTKRVLLSARRSCNFETASTRPAYVELCSLQTKQTVVGKFSESQTHTSSEAGLSISLDSDCIQKLHTHEFKRIMIMHFSQFTAKDRNTKRNFRW